MNCSLYDFRMLCFHGDLMNITCFHGDWINIARFHGDWINIARFHGDWINIARFHGDWINIARFFGNWMNMATQYCMTDTSKLHRNTDLIVSALYLDKALYENSCFK